MFATRSPMHVPPVGTTQANPPNPRFRRHPDCDDFLMCGAEGWAFCTSSGDLADEARVPALAQLRAWAPVRSAGEGR